MNSIPLVKVGGILAGHDYAEIFEVRGQINVRLAVHTVFNGKNIHGETGDWWVTVDTEIANLIHDV